MPSGRNDTRKFQYFSVICMPLRQLNTPSNTARKYPLMPVNFSGVACVSADGMFGYWTGVAVRRLPDVSAQIAFSFAGAAGFFRGSVTCR